MPTSIGSAFLSSNINSDVRVIVRATASSVLDLDFEVNATPFFVPDPLPVFPDPYFATPNPQNLVLEAGYAASWDPNPAQTFEGWKIGPQIRGLHQSKLQHMGYPAELWMPAVDGSRCSCVKETNQQGVRDCPSCFGVGKLPGFYKFLHDTIYFDHSEIENFLEIDGVELNTESKPNKITLSRGVFSGSFTTDFVAVANGHIPQDWEVDIKYKTPNGGFVDVEFSTDGVNFYHLSEINGENRPTGHTYIQLRVTLTRASINSRSPEFYIARIRRLAYEDANFDIVNSRSCTKNAMDPGDILVLWDWQSTIPMLTDAQGVIREEIKKIWTAPLDFFDTTIQADTPKSAIKDLENGPHPFIKFKTGIESEHIFVLTQAAYSEQLHTFSYQSFQARRPQKESEVYNKVDEGFTFEYPEPFLPVVRASASSLIRLREAIWCPNVIIRNIASSSSVLIGISNGSIITNEAITTIILTGNADGTVV